MTDTEISTATRLGPLIDRLLALLPVPYQVDWATVPAAAWRRQRFHSGLLGSSAIDAIELEDLFNIDQQKQQLETNTRQFLKGLPANNALLWGARGTGKSSLIHALLNTFAADGLRLVEVAKEDLVELPLVVEALSQAPYRFILFCDDLSFEADDGSYKQLKSALEGSLFKTATNILIYATSNRRHLVPEYMADNQAAQHVGGELHEAEVVEEKISLSDRFGLWLSFYPFQQEDYLQVVRHWVAKHAAEHDVQVDLQADELRAEALRWALARGVRSGRTAQYFARHWIGRAGM